MSKTLNLTYISGFDKNRLMIFSEDGSSNELTQDEFDQFMTAMKKREERLKPLQDKFDKLIDKVRELREEINANDYFRLKD